MTVPKAKRKTDPCRCGSGKQYRYCHGAPQEREEPEIEVRRNPRQLFLWIVLVGAPLAYVGGMFLGPRPAASPPPGPTPPGKVWSAAHGHWHDVDGSASGRELPAFDPSDGKPWDHEYTLDRPDEAPEGMVWSEAHGHWHPSGG